MSGCTLGSSHTSFGFRLLFWILGLIGHADIFRGHVDSETDTPPSRPAAPQVYGFYDECYRKYSGPEVWKYFTEACARAGSVLAFGTVVSSQAVG